MKIWLLRHAESEWNAVGRWQGHGDPPLSKAGRSMAGKQAPEIVRRVTRADRAVRLFCSDLRRAVETARFVGEVMGVEPTRSAELRELDVGSWTGLTRDAIEEIDAPVLESFESEDPHVRPGDGETRAEIRARVREAALRLAEEDPASDLLLVVHLGVIRALMPGTEAEHLELLETDPEAIRRARSPAARR